MADGLSAPTGGGVNPNILMEIFGSSESVQARVAAYEKAKTEAQEALAELRIGQNARQAYDDANARLAEAQAITDKANKDADAAITTLGDAQNRAVEIIVEAERQKVRVIAEIEAARAAHEQWMASTKTELDERRRAIEANAAEVERDRVDVQAAMGQAQTAQMAADAMRAKADEEIASARAAAASAKELAQKFQDAIAGVGRRD